MLCWGLNPSQPWDTVTRQGCGVWCGVYCAPPNHPPLPPSPPLPSPPLLSPPLHKVHFSGRGWLLRFLALVWTAKTDSHFSIGNVLGLGPITLLSSAALQASVLKVGAAYLSALDVESLVAICSQTCPCECTSPTYHPTTLTHSLHPPYHTHSLTPTLTPSLHPPYHTPSSLLFTL